jgi:hypothetical protein
LPNAVCKRVQLRLHLSNGRHGHDVRLLSLVRGRSGGKNHSVLGLILVHACEEVLESGNGGTNVEGLRIVPIDMSHCPNVGSNLYIFAVQKGSKHFEEETTQVLGVLGEARHFIQEGTIVTCRDQLVH